MRALEILQNGKLLAVIGSELLEDGMLSAGVELQGAKGKLSTLGVSNYDEEKGQAVLYWKENHSLKVGDEITIRITESHAPDKPDRIENPTLNED